MSQTQMVTVNGKTYQVFTSERGVSITTVPRGAYLKPGSKTYNEVLKASK